MNSAGYTPPPGSGPPAGPGGYGPPGAAGYTPMTGPQVPTYTGQDWGSFGPQANIGFKFNVPVSTTTGDQLAQDAMSNAKTGMIISGAGKGLDTLINAYFVGRGFELAEKFYDTQLSIAVLKQGVANKQLDVVDHGQVIAQEMHQDQIQGETEKARIEQRTQVALARINQNGLTDRARVYAASEAFTARRDPFYGSTAGGLS